MTPDELRTLAERVKQGIAWLPPIDRSREADDALRLAEAVLAGYPADDGEPITGEWLESVGRQSYWSVWGFELDLRIAFEPDRGCWYYPVLPVPLRTRNDVRRLCAALGVPLQEVK